MVSREDFRCQSRRAIFTALGELVAANERLDPVTVSEKLVEQSLLGVARGSDYLTELADRMVQKPGRPNVRAYARIVRNGAARRRLLDVGRRIIELAEDPEGSSIEELVSGAEREINAVCRPSGSDAPRRVGKVATGLKRRLEKLAAHGQETTGVSSGFQSLDRMTGGFQPTDLVVIAGRPSTGKTALMVNIAERATRNQNDEKAVLFFSLESPAESLALRMMSSVSGIERTRLGTGPRWGDWEQLGKALVDLQERRLFIDDTATTLDTIRTRALRVARSNGLELVFVDALQVVRHCGESGDRGAELEEISWSLKRLARDLRCPVMASSYLHRGPERRGNRRPCLEDLRGSAGIEEAADLVLLVYRDEVYNERSDMPGTIEITMGKNRNGRPLRPHGWEIMAYDESLDRLEDRT